jgi:hypothetical protein
MVGCREVVHGEGQRRNVVGDRRLPISSGGEPHSRLEKQKDIQIYICVYKQ